MAHIDVPVPSTPAGSGKFTLFQHPLKYEHDLETLSGTGASSPSPSSAPHTPYAITRTLEHSCSSPSSEALRSDGNRERQSSSQRLSGSPGVKVERAPEPASDPFVTTSDSAQETPYRPRPDRFGVDITPELAQAIFPSDACVFVANLVASKPDDVVRDAVIEAFSTFGTCYVKVKRDNAQMPYAFCQYEVAYTNVDLAGSADMKMQKVEDSNHAIVEGRTMLILGRPCRTERAKVNRSLYLSRRTGGTISEEEARKILANMGDIQSIWTSTPTDIEMFRLPEGIWVQFAFFQDSRDAAQAFKDNSEFRLEQPQLPDDLRAKLTNSRSHVTPSRVQTPIRQGPYTTPASRYSQVADATSIFIGNLSSNVTLDSLRGLFGKFGVVRNIEIVCRPGTSGSNVHAFVEYESPRAADRALNAEHILGHVHLRVERRQSTPFSMSRSQSSRFSSVTGSPRRRSYASSSSGMPSTPFSGSFFPVEFNRPNNCHPGNDVPYALHSSLSPYFPGAYPQAHQRIPAAMPNPGHTLIYGSPASGHFGGENPFGPLAFHPSGPPHFAVPQMPMMMGQQIDAKSSVLPSVPEHQGQ